MHYTHVLCISAMHAEDARRRADYWLDNNLSGIGDYFEIEEFTFGTGEELRALQVSADPKRAMECLREIAGWQQAEMRQVFDATDLAVLAGTPALPLAQAAEDFEIRLIGYRMHTLGALLAGFYCTDSHFYDVPEGTANPHTRLRAWEAGEIPDDLWLVQVDIHN